MASVSEIEKLSAHKYRNWSADIKYVLLEKHAWSNGSEQRIKVDPLKPEAIEKEIRYFETDQEQHYS